MLEKIIVEVRDAIVATVNGADDIASALRTAIVHQMVGVIKNTGASRILIVHGQVPAYGYRENRR